MRKRKDASCIMPSTQRSPLLAVSWATLGNTLVVLFFPLPPSLSFLVVDAQRGFDTLSLSLSRGSTGPIVTGFTCFLLLFFGWFYLFRERLITDSHSNYYHKLKHEPQNLSIFLAQKYLFRNLGASTFPRVTYPVARFWPRPPLYFILYCCSLASTLFTRDVLILLLSCFFLSSSGLFPLTRLINNH